MSNIRLTKPSFVFGYWRPWQENANFIDSYLDYSKDTSLVKYGADTVGNYINQASKEQVKAINQLGKAIGRGLNVLSEKMSDINESLVFLNRNMDVQIEQQKLSNLLLQNIAELLRVPDSEKERQHSIELGIKFFVNAAKDSDLFEDALEELLKAESLMKQDYFVLHRIGCIYLYAQKYINPEKAIDYFLRAAKYASVESDSNAVRLVNVLTNNIKTVNSELYNSEKQIGILAADSYEKAALCSYIMGRFEDAVSYQNKALKHNDIPQNKFFLAKYLVRVNQISDAINYLDQCIEEVPLLALAVFKEIDLFNEPAVLKLIQQKNENINLKIKTILEKWSAIDSVEAKKIIQDLKKLLTQSYEIKISEIDKYKIKAISSNKKIKDLIKKIDLLSSKTKDAILLSSKTKDAILIDISNEKKNSIIKDLEKAKELPFEKMLVSYEKIKKEIDNNELKIGTRSFGGIVFYIDIANGYGLVCSKVIGKEIWGINGQFGTSKNFGSGQSNTNKVVDLASTKQEKGFFKTTNIPIDTAAKICVNCKIGGFDDWYLPSTEELTLAYKTVKKYGVLGKKNLWSSSESDYLSKEMTNFGRTEVVVGYIHAMSLNPNTGEIRKNYADNRRHEKNNFVAIRKFQIQKI